MVMVAASKVCGNCTGLTGWEVACGTISFIIAGITGLLALGGVLQNRTHQTFISVFQFLWWIGKFSGSLMSLDSAKN